jgi:hypothetical protein
MATTVIWADGFEHYGTGSTGIANMLKGLWSAVGGTGTNGPVNGVARTGSHYAAINTNGAASRRAFGSRLQVGIAFGIRFPSLPSDDRTLFSLNNVGNSNVVTLIWNSDGSIGIYKGDHTGTLLATTEQVLTAATWHHVEILVTISDTAGAIELRVDNDPVAILADLDLDAVAVTQVVWYCRAAGGVNHQIDDAVAHTGDDFIGPARVLTSYLAADLSPFGDWTITGAASGAEAVDEAIPDDDTSYITAADAGDVARFLMPSLPADVSEIVAIHIPFYARQNEAGLTRVQTTLLSDAEAVDGAEHSLTPSYSYKEDAFNTNPATGGAWDKASFEAAILEVTRTI